MSITLDRGTRRARKAHRCELCWAHIRPGDHHAFQVIVYDDRVYTWRTCMACERDGIVYLVAAWCDPDDGVHFDLAVEWAEEAVNWPRVYLYRRPARPTKASEQWAARNYLARLTKEEA